MVTRWSVWRLYLNPPALLFLTRCSPLLHLRRHFSAAASSGGYAPTPASTQRALAERAAAHAFEAGKRWERVRLAWQVTGSARVAGAASSGGGGSGSGSDGDDGAAAVASAPEPSPPPAAASSNGGGGSSGGFASANGSGVSGESGSESGEVRFAAAASAPGAAGSTPPPPPPPPPPLDAADLSASDVRALADALAAMRRLRRVRRPRVYAESIKMSLLVRPEAHIKFTRPLPLPSMVQILLQVWEEGP